MLATAKQHSASSKRFLEKNPNDCSNILDKHGISVILNFDFLVWIW